MRITLYKDCVLNDKYKDIFCTKTLLENYLSGLQYKIINIEDTFSRNEDVLYIENENNFDVMDYNYLKVEDGMTAFYAFIIDISWLSETYVIHYKEDIFANHFDKIKVRNGLQIRSRIKKLFNNGVQTNIKYFKEPIESEGNNTPNITSVMEQVDTVLTDKNGNTTDIQANTYDYVSIVVKLQLYSLQSGTDKVVDREPIIYKVCLNVLGTWWYHFNDFGLTNLINYLIKNQPSYHIKGKLYEIDQIYCVPTYLISPEPTVDQSKYSDIETFDESQSSGIGFLRFDENFGKLYELTASIPYDRTLYAIGLLNKPYNIVKNGTSTSIKIRMEIYGYTLCIFLFVQNTMYDVTNEFEVDIPYQSISAQALQTRRTNILIESNELYNKIANLNVDKKLTNEAAITDAISIGSKVSKNVAIHSITGVIGGISNATENILEKEATLDKLENDINTLDVRIFGLNKKLYSNAEILANKVSFKTGKYGLLTYKIDEENTSQIISLQKMTGFLINEIVYDSINNNYKNYLINNNTYDVLQYSEVNIYGSIAQKYLRIIEGVLLSGIRIWGSTNINVQ